MPIFFSCLPREAGKSFSTMKAEMPWLPPLSVVLSVMAKTTKGIGHVAVGDEALGAVQDVVVALVQHSGGLLARGVGAGAGLGQTEAPIFSPEHRSGRYFCFCSSVPFSKMGAQHREVWAETMTAVVPQTLASSSTHMA